MALNRTVVGVDLGTNETKVVVAEKNDTHGIRVVGIAKANTQGVRKGVIVNLESAASSIREAVVEAQKSAGIRISDAHFNFTGAQIESVNTSSLVNIKGKDVSSEDVSSVIQQARSIPIATDQEVLHILTQSFVVDNQDVVRTPIGISGKRLEAKVHVISNTSSVSRNINKCAHLAKLNNKGLVFSPLASAEAVLLRDEKDLGTLLIDIGAGTTDGVLMFNGAPRFCFSLPIGGTHITNDIAACLRTSYLTAEELKQTYGHCIYHAVREDEKIEILGLSGKMSRIESRMTLVKVIRARIFEIFSLIRDTIVDNGFENLIGSGVIITGGGANLKGIAELGEGIFNCPVRLGRPIHFQGLNDSVIKPEITTALGLVLYSMNCREESFIVNYNKFTGIYKKASNWLKEHF